MALFRRHVRSRPIRLFLISMFAVPLVSLVALWVFAASLTVSSAISNQNYNAAERSTDAGILVLSEALPQERAQSYIWLVTDRRASNGPMLAARKLVDNGIPTARAALSSQLGQLSAEPRAALSALLADLGHLGQIRAAIDAGSLSPAAAFQAYTNIVDAEFQYYYTSIQEKSAEQADASIAAVDADYGLEMASREATVVGGALADRGQMSEPARQLFVSSAGGRTVELNSALALMTPSLRVAFLGLVNSPVSQQFQTLENQILAAGTGPVPVNPTTWENASFAYIAGLEAALNKDGGLLASQSASLSDRLLTEAILASGLGLVAVIASVFLLVWFGRKVTGDLTRLDDSVRGMAEERLPRVVERLRQGEDVDVLAESPPPGKSSIQEISQIAGSFSTVQAAAVAAAVDQAKLRKGVSQVFLNISMRNQSLLHRQLGMLDSMERRTGEPEALADLFRLDHLTTRMRRHAESLIILSGSVPGRGWRDPVPVVDVLRAAVAEVEDYVRVDVVSESRDLVAGNAVNDVIHLVAELVENATVFSPPNTRIEVRADRVGTGLAAEIEDRGLGLSAEERADINRRLAGQPEFDLANSEQLGLFVVSQLAARHNIKVSLCASVYGGTTAVLLLPFGVVVREEETGPRGVQGAWPAYGGGDGGSGGWGLPPGVYELAPSAGGPQPQSPADGAGDLPPFGLSGRHRLPPSPAAPMATTPMAAPRMAATQLQDTVAMAPWPHAFQPIASRREPSPPAGPGGTDNGQPAGEPFMPSSRPPQGPGRPGPASSGSHLGMPIRVPQASLAPQLQASSGAGPQAAAREVPEVDERSPEATRSMMAMMQQGWQRGRVDDLDNPEGAPGDGN